MTEIMSRARASCSRKVQYTTNDDGNAVVRLEAGARQSKHHLSLVQVGHRLEAVQAVHVQSVYGVYRVVHTAICVQRWR